MKRYGSMWLGFFAIFVCSGWLLSAAASAEDDASKKIVDYYRRKANVPPSAQIEVKDLQPSKIKGAKQGTMSVSGRAVTFIISDDGKYAIFGEVEDLSVDPYKKVMEKIDLKGEHFKGKADAKVRALEEIDRHIVGPLLEALPAYGAWRILVSPDHRTTLRTRAHAHGAVPFALAGTGVAAGGQTSYDEYAGPAAGWTFARGCELMPRFLGRG